MKHLASSKRVVVVGGGPAGLTAAVFAAEAGCRVVLCEQLDRPGAKLLASGGGRCNLSNTLTDEQFIAAFGRQGRFMAPALAAMSREDLRQFLARLGVPTMIDPDGFGIYPASQSAVDVQSALWRRCRELRVDVRLMTRVTGVGVSGGDREVTNVTTSRGEIAAEAVIVAAGGCGYPSLGGSQLGYELARQAGHEIVPPTPALVPLVSADRWVARCAGLSLANVRVRVDLPGQPAAGRRGQLLFTHRGLSGPAVLNLSGDVAALLAAGHTPVPLLVELLPDAESGHWARQLDRWRHQSGGRMLRTLLGQVAPARLAEALLDLAGIDRDTRASQVPRAQGDRLAGLLAGLPIAIRITEGFARAMVTRGGVSLKQMDPRTLSSRLVRGLFFAGEVLDLAGPTGGFNLQWAFSSGRLAGESAGKS